MKFGTGQLKKPTPQKMNLLFDFLAGFLGLLSGFIMGARFIPHHFSDVADEVITSLLIPACLLIKRFFGAEIPKGKIDAQDIKVVDEPKND